jgi:hypothetical protein
LRLRDSEQESQTVIKVGADFYIHASSLTSRRATRVLVSGESFAVFEVGGDILQTPNEPLGFFHRDTPLPEPLRIENCRRDSLLSELVCQPGERSVTHHLSNPDLGFQE